MVKKIFESSLLHKPLMKKGSSLWKKDLLEEIMRLREIDVEGQKWSEKNYWGGYTSYSSTSQSFDKLHRFSSTFAALEKKIRPQVHLFAKKLEWDCDVRDLQVSTLWVNVMPQGTTHSFHHHPLSVVSGTFYVQVPKDSCGIQFEDPRLGFMMAAPPRKASAVETLQPYLTVQPQEGDVVLFESWMKHQVPPNPSTRERVSISFNYDWIRN